MMMELSEDVLSPFQYIQAWDSNYTDHFRYSPKTAYGWISEERLPWNAYMSPEDGVTQPWIFSEDRQVALVEFHNVSEGFYACANGGHCVAPDKCACSNGWIGFDCRVPVCEQGYYEPSQDTFVKGTNKNGELDAFEKFMEQNSSYRLDPSGRGYSNPIVATLVEKFENATFVEREVEESVFGARYLRIDGHDQGGYACSIRSVTAWENYREDVIFEHPNYFSRYMDRKIEADGNIYTHWDGMEWEPTHHKSQQLQVDAFLFLSKNHTEAHSVKERYFKKSSSRFIYTDQGYRKDGDWAITGASWTKGTCIIEFKRVCEDVNKTFDLEGKRLLKGRLVQDTDKSFRPRVHYDDKKAYPLGLWFQEGGECVDHVVRGCFNNGTCVRPNQCKCTEGWTGSDCTIPICQQTCQHNGNCTHPDTCTCEKGWTGYDCSIAVCAQECNNLGSCVAPDTCKCTQWPNEWRDGRAGGGVPLFRKPNGDPQMTGWTGYDCSTPICVQAERFRLNVDMSQEKRNRFIVNLGGHGMDGTLECDSVRCPAYDEMVTSNDGRSFQTGCGFDPLDTGCCYEFDGGSGISYMYRCFSCMEGYLISTPHNVTCFRDNYESWVFNSLKDVPLAFKTPKGYPKLCGRWHNPGVVENKYYTSDRLHAGPQYSNRNGLANFTSDRFLCNRHEWEQGDYVDDAGLGNEGGLGADSGLALGRHIRVNYNNYIQDDNDPELWKSGPLVAGEGIFECYNFGSCIAPDVCTCRDGFSGFDCRTPLCRHQQASGKIVGCQNGGSCRNKDDCHCIQVVSVLWTAHANAERGLTGWTGTDCSMPMCVQGFYDPFCNESFAPGGEGCYHCANGGNCVAPDTCKCHEGWTGFDCRTPICEAVADPLVRKQLMTSDPEKIQIFETDPCGMVGFDTPGVDGGVAYRGNCTMPNQCTCVCRETYDARLCEEFGGDHCKVPFHDPLYKYRNVLAPNEMFGTRSCYSGYEGMVDERDFFKSCHMKIFEPDYVTEKTIDLLVWGAITLVFGTGSYIYVRRKLHRRHIMAKMERRKTRRLSEITGGGRNAFAFRTAGDGEKND